MGLYPWHNQQEEEQKIMGKMSCIYCNNLETRVLQSEGYYPFKRDRRCPKCEGKFKTIEVALDYESENLLKYVSKTAIEGIVVMVMNQLREPKRVGEIARAIVGNDNDHLGLGDFIASLQKKESKDSQPKMKE